MRGWRQGRIRMSRQPWNANVHLTNPAKGTCGSYFKNEAAHTRYIYRWRGINRRLWSWLLVRHHVSCESFIQKAWTFNSLSSCWSFRAIQLGPIDQRLVRRVEREQRRGENDQRAVMIGNDVGWMNKHVTRKPHKDTDFRRCSPRAPSNHYVQANPGNSKISTQGSESVKRQPIGPY